MYRSTILDVSSRRRYMVSFMTRPLYPRCPLNRRLSGHEKTDETTDGSVRIAPQDEASLSITGRVQL